MNKTTAILLGIIVAALAIWALTAYKVDINPTDTPTPTSTVASSASPSASSLPTVSSTVTTVPTRTMTPGKTNLITLSSPKINTVVHSPLTLTGQARGTWYFEASFPVKIYNANGKQHGSNAAQAQGEWMTTNFVPFSATLTFSTPGTATGYIVLEKDNPSGLSQNDDELLIPIRFQ
jgi:hypothetical protein